MGVRTQKGGVEMDVMLHVTSPEAGVVAIPLMKALGRGGVDWACFVTNDGTELLREEAFVEALQSAGRAVVCEHSWEAFGGSAGDCPIERGSQTINSAMMAEADRVVSF